jgi:hypothetical protein
MSMPAAQNSRFPTLAVFILASATVTIGVCACIHRFRGDMFSNPPAFWVAVLLFAPVLSTICAAALWREKGRVRWLAAMATIIALLQVSVWAFVINALLHFYGAQQ